MIDIVNGLINAVGVVITALLALLPTSPFNYVYNVDNSFVQNMNYILPLSQAVAHLSAYLVSVALYYGLRIVLRWVRVASN